ncbi:MAG: type II toxin-antitoxin system RelE family toxin [Acidimicrobiales bacterium]
MSSSPARPGGPSNGCHPRSRSPSSTSSAARCAIPPHRVGKPLRGDLAGLHNARVGAYRVVREIDDNEATVTVVAIDHRADIYRPH